MSQNKPGYRSSEFYLALAATLVGAFLASGILPETHWAVRVAGMLAVGLSAMGYSTGRSSVKVAQIDAAALAKPSAAEPPKVQ